MDADVEAEYYVEEKATPGKDTPKANVERWANTREQHGDILLKSMSSHHNFQKEMCESASTMLGRIYAVCRGEMGDNKRIRAERGERDCDGKLYTYDPLVDVDPYLGHYDSLGNATNWAVFCLQQAFFEYRGDAGWTVDSHDAATSWTASSLYSIMRIENRTSFTSTDRNSTSECHSAVPNGLKTAQQSSLASSSNAKTGRVQVHPECTKEEWKKRAITFRHCFRLAFGDDDKRKFCDAIVTLQPPECLSSARSSMPVAKEEEEEQDTSGDEEMEQALLSEMDVAPNAVVTKSPSVSSPAASALSPSFRRSVSPKQPVIVVRATADKRLVAAHAKKMAIEAQKRQKLQFDQAKECIEQGNIRGIKSRDVSNEAIMNEIAKAAAYVRVKRDFIRKSSESIAKTAYHNAIKTIPYEIKIREANERLEATIQRIQIEERFKKEFDLRYKFCDTMNDDSEEAVLLRSEFDRRNPLAGKVKQWEVDELNSEEYDIFNSSMEEDMKCEMQQEEVWRRQVMRNELRKKCVYPTFEDKCANNDWIEWRKHEITDEMKARYSTPNPSEKDDRMNVLSLMGKKRKRSMVAPRVQFRNDKSKPPPPGEVVDYCTLFGFDSTLDADREKERLTRLMHDESARSFAPWQVWFWELYEGHERPASKINRDLRNAQQKDRTRKKKAEMKRRQDQNVRHGMSPDGRRVEDWEAWNESKARKKALQDQANRKLEREEEKRKRIQNALERREEKKVEEQKKRDAKRIKMDCNAEKKRVENTREKIRAEYVADLTRKRQKYEVVTIRGEDGSERTDKKETRYAPPRNLEAIEKELGVVRIADVVNVEGRVTVTPYKVGLKVRGYTAARTSNGNDGGNAHGNALTSSKLAFPAKRAEYERQERIAIRVPGTNASLHLITVNWTVLCPFTQASEIADARRVDARIRAKRMAFAA